MGCWVVKIYPQLETDSHYFDYAYQSLIAVECHTWAQNPYSSEIVHEKGKMECYSA
jgi:hypothetical protein